MDTLTELEHLLRPAGGGLYLVSTGRAEQLRLQQRLYGAASETDVAQRFRDGLRRIASARAVLLGVPSDVGAGFVRGANLGPQEIRSTLLREAPHWPDEAARLGVVDIGDVFVVPQLLHDSMLSGDQLRRTRRALYPTLSEADAARLPVSPLSIAERALDLVFTLNPAAAPLVLGGDHSVAWPVSAALARRQTRPWAIVQIDAHTDLLAERLGITYCFATWSYHANELLGRGGRLVQLGIRASGRTKEHWEGTLDVKQLWAEECRASPEAVLDALESHLLERGIEAVYFSNDIDGTDASEADATGTPEPGGLSPDFVVEVIRRLKRRFRFLGGDVVEVAPPLARSPGGVERTLGNAVRYLRETIGAVVGS